MYRDIIETNLYTSQKTVIPQNNLFNDEAAR